jgi:predicted phosphodiesterase
MRALIGALLAACWGLCPALAHDGPHTPLPHWQQATGWPDRIITTFQGDPQTSFTATWRTEAAVGETVAQIALATPDTRFDLASETVRARTSRFHPAELGRELPHIRSDFNFGIGPVHYHTAQFEGLQPGTLYAWRVQGARGQWSEWYQTRTAPADGPVSFVYFGDAQNGIRSHWSRVIRAAHKAAPDAGFYLHAGDLVDKGARDRDWAEWFDAGDFLHAQIPSILVRGNHENVAVQPSDRSTRDRVATPFWRAQFALPEEDDLPESLHEMAYQVRYSQDLHIFVVDSAQFEFETQARWLDKALRESDATWKVVSMHHPYFTPPAFDRRKVDSRRRDAFAPVIERNDVDLVLTGHIHTYNRLSERTARRSRAEGDQVGTIFAISASGAKNSNLDGVLPAERIGDGMKDYGNLSMDRTAGNTPMFQVIEIDGPNLTYTAHMATGDSYDRFSLTKTEDGKRTLVEGTPEFGEQRLFGNTLPYRDWRELQ